MRASLLTLPAFEKNSYTSLSDAFKGICNHHIADGINQNEIPNPKQIMFLIFITKKAQSINLVCKNSPLIPFWICLRLCCLFLVPKSPAIEIEFQLIRYEQSSRSNLYLIFRLYNLQHKSKRTLLILESQTAPNLERDVSIS